MSETLYFTGNVNDSLSFTGDGSTSQIIATGVVAAAGPAGSDGTPGPSDHTLLSNIGVNTHAQIDTAIAASTSHIANTSNPHSVTKSQIGLGNVDNTSDANKPVSTAQSTAINAKVADAINDGTTTVAPSQNAVFDALALKQPLDSDLTTIAGLTATTDSFLQAKSSAWAARTIAQVKTDLGLTGTNSGDQTISDATITTSDITTNNFTTAKHGFVPKGTNVGNFLKDDGTWAAAGGGSGDMVLASTQTVTGAKTFNSGALLDKGNQVFNVKAYGAIGNDTADDTTAIQNAINAAAVAGGIVWFPAGTYKITAALKLYTGTTPTITAYSDITLAGTGASNGIGSIIKQYTTGADVIKALNDAANGAQTQNVTIQDLLLLWGTATKTNSGNGIYFAQQAASGPAFYQINIKNVTASGMQGTGKYGFNFESLIVSTVDTCMAVVCANGFYLNGAVSGAYSSVNTSVTFLNCYANMDVNGLVGYNIFDSTYVTLMACAADYGQNSTGTAYLVDGSNAISFYGCGLELAGTNTLSNGWKVQGTSAQVGIYNCYAFLSKTMVDVYITGTSTGVSLVGFQDNSSVSGSTGLKVDAGSSVTEMDNSYGSAATPRSINATGIDTILSDSAGNLTTKIANLTTQAVFSGSTSGATTLKATATAGSTTLTLPAATDTLVGKATTDTFTNKTYDTAGTGNSLSINGVAATANTGTGSVVRATTPTLVTPVLGVATATSINKLALTAPTTSATLTVADGASLITIGAFALSLTASATSNATIPAGTNTLYSTKAASITSAQLLASMSDATGTGASAFATSPTLVTPVLGVATATSINKVAITAPATSATLTIANGKTLTANNSITLAGTDSTTMTFPSTTATIARTDAAQTFTGVQTGVLFIETAQAITVSTNAGTADVTHKTQNFTNSSAATMAITLATASAVDGQSKIVRVYDFSAVAQTIGWTNTENSTVSVPTTSNGSTTLPLTVGFIFNGSTSKWRCVASV